MPNLVDELGYGYFTEFFSGALFLRGDELLQVSSAGSSLTTCSNYETGAAVRIPNDFFTGYKAFEYPLLGYRKIDANKLGYLTRRQSTARGIRPSSIHLAASPATSELRNTGAIPYEASPNAERSKAIAAFRPRFDTLEQMPQLLSGELLGLVLTPSILIEPSVDAAQDWYSIYYRQSLIGKINSRGAVTWTSPAFASLLPELG